MTTLPKDGFTKVFHNVNQFYNFIGKVENETQWSTDVVKNLEFTDVDKPLDQVLDLAEDYLCDPDILCDTAKNAKLVLVIEDTYIPMRTTALRSAYERVKISGSALGKLKKTKLADILTDCAKVADGKTQILTVAEKVSAVLGSDYVILPIPQIFKATEDYLKKFVDVKFVEGYFSHDITSGVWELPAIEGEALIKYKAALVKLDVEYSELIPILRVVTSNTGMSGANLFPSIKRLGTSVNMRLCPEIRLNHKGKASMTMFSQNLEGVFSKLTQSIEVLTSLTEIELNYPINVMTGIYKRIKAPKRYALQAIAKHKSLIPADEPYNAHKLYFDMFDIVSYMKSNPKEKDICGKEILLEETLGKIPFLDFTDFDLPGEITW